MAAQKSMSKRIESALETKWREADKAMKEGNQRLETVAWHKADGAMFLAARIGYGCHCERDQTETTHCACKSLKKMAGGSSLGNSVFDGIRCRDGSGAFVPVSQCKGPVGRDRAGRFVSLK